jgi:protein CpxP
MKNRLIAAVAVFTLGASIAVAAPHGRFDGKRGRGGEFGPRFAQKLNLTDAQKEQIKAIRKESRDANASFFQTTRQTRQELRAARAANDTAKAEALAATLESQRAQLKAAHDATRQRILSVLTPEQRAELDRLEGEQKAKREARRGKGKRP